jgi:hypothetical protein
MKLQNIFRMQAVVIGFAGLLLLASTARAQDIANTSFDDGPNVAPFSQPSPAPTTNDLNSEAGEPQAFVPAALLSGPVVLRGAGIVRWNLIKGWLIVGMLVCIAIVALYALSEAKRANRNLSARLDRNRSNSPAS